MPGWAFLLQVSVFSITARAVAAQAVTKAQGLCSGLPFLGTPVNLQCSLAGAHLTRPYVHTGMHVLAHTYLFTHAHIHTHSPLCLTFLLETLVLTGGLGAFTAVAVPLSREWTEKIHT